MTLANAEYLPVMGRALSAAETATLQCSLPLLSSKYNAPVTLWGKVTGLRRDYLVAQAAPHGFFGPRVSLYSTDGGGNWALLEELNEDQVEFCEQIRGLYQGDPLYAYKMRKDIPPDPEPSVGVPAADAEIAAAQEALRKAAEEADGAEEEEEEEQEDEQEEEEDEETAAAALAGPRRRKPKYMILQVTEAIRLSHFVQVHDAACRLTVRGQFLLQGGPVGERNRAFSGQPLHNALKPSCYLKAAHLGDPARNTLLYGPTYNAHTDYLAPITDDAPVGIWTVKYDPTLNVVAVQNLLFDGSLFWYRPGTLACGQIYYGTGERNFEMCFLLQ